MVDALITLLGGGRFSRSVGRTLRVDAIHKKPAQSYNFFLIYANKKNTKKVYIYVVYIW